MRAVRLTGWQQAPELLEVPAPTPGPGEVLLRVDGAGLCHSDLHVMRWPAGTLPYQLPFTLGHEVSGTVAALGSPLAGIAEGDRVLVYGRWGCGRCWQCAQGIENRCERGAELDAYGAGLGRDGGLAEYMLVPAARHLVPIGDLDPLAAAPLTDAALTPYHAIKRSWHQLRPNGAVVVIGLGGLGHMAVQLLRALSPVRVIAIDVRAEALALARAAGVDAALPADGLTAADVREQTGRAGATLVLDCVGSDSTLTLAAGVIAPGGDISIVGRGGGALSVSPATIPYECSVALPSWGTVPELVEVVALARAGAIRVEFERFTLDETIDAYGRLERGEIVGRAVVAPGL